MKTIPLPTGPEAAALLVELASHPSQVPPNPVDGPLVLYGAGRLGRLAAELFRQLDVPVAYALDRSASSAGDLSGIRVIAPETPNAEERATRLVAVCVVTVPYEPIRDNLIRLGWRHVLPVYDVLATYADRIPMNNGWFAGPLDDEDIASIGEVMARWDDARSRAAHVQFLAWRLHRAEWHFADAPVVIDDRYFIDAVVGALGCEERFLDAGAHRGDVLARFLKVVGGRFSQALAIEPDRDNFGALRQTIASLPANCAGRIQVLECALAAVDGRLPFCHGSDLASRLMAGAAVDAPARRLDGIDFPVTFAKIHLEGSELEALRGGIDTLRKLRPILAVTVYHSRDGLWRIPHYLMKHLPDYRFLMRAHGWCGTGSVIYAIPRERSR